MNILVTGGAGYIGSHTCLELLAAGYRVIVLDDLSNASRESLRRVEALSGGAIIPFFEGSIADRLLLREIFSTNEISAVVHFAGSKAVGESVDQPLLYYRNNIAGTTTLLEEMARAKVKQFIFSSSATVYGDSPDVPFAEDQPLGKPNNPYGKTKLFIEEMCRDLAASDPSWSIILLRYFNPVGAHESGTIGEDPRGIPNNLMPYITQVAVGRREALAIFGSDYDTPDGTCVRDFIHVVDLAEGHVAALKNLQSLPGCTAINLGTGVGYSVLEVLHAMEAAVGRPIPYRYAPRRLGDSPKTFSDPTKAKHLLNWQTQRSLAQMCEDSWRWQENNPFGYDAEGSSAAKR
jgi:UDP-glucose 4-epimerase